MADVRGKRFTGKNYHNCKAVKKHLSKKNEQGIKGLDKWGKPLTIEVPADAADILRVLLGKEKGGRGSGRACRRHKGKGKFKANNRTSKNHKGCKKNNRNSKKKEAKKDLETDDAVKAEMKDLQNVAGVTKGPEELDLLALLKSSINNNEEIPDLIRSKLPALEEIKENVEEEEEEEAADKNKPIWKQKRDEGRARKAKEAEEKEELKKQKQEERAKKKEERLAKKEEKLAKKAEKEKNRKSVKKNKHKKEKVKFRTRNFRKKNNKNKEQKKEESAEEVDAEEVAAESEDVTVMLAKMSPEEKNELFNVLKKLLDM